jgi:hypothetical protein
MPAERVAMRQPQRHRQPTIDTIARASSLSASITETAGSGLDTRICVSVAGICRRQWLGN